MPHPALYTRLHNFLRDANNGLESPAPAKVDAELNGIQLSLAQTVEKLRGITTADGRLRNVASAIAQALVGTWSDTSDGTTTVLTDIPWSADMSVDSVLVLQTSTPLRPDQIVSVQDDGSGFLELTLLVAPTLGVTMTVWAFAPGAGVLTQLASVLVGQGASLIGVEDATGLLAAANVEDALAEIAGNLAAFEVLVGDVADLFKRDGTVPATADFDMGGFKITNADDGSAAGDYVTVRQIATYIAAWSNLQQFYLKRDGTTAMAGPLNFGNNKGRNLADPDLAQPLDAVNVRAMLRTIATSGASPVGVVTDFIGETAPTGWLFCDGSAYTGEAYPVLYGLLGSAYREGSAQGARVAAFPKLIAGTNPGEITAGVITLGDITSLLSNAGVGYTGAPLIVCENTDGGIAVSSQPTFSITLSAIVTDGPNVSGGTITAISVVSGGADVRAGAILRVVNALAATPGEPALAELPSGYFRTPDFRGRVTVGAGTESKTPGISDPPDVTKGDDYNATPRDIGDQGGEEQSLIGYPNLPSETLNGNGSRTNALPAGTAPSGQPWRGTGHGHGWGAADIYGTGFANAGQTALSNMPPFHVLNKIIKAA